MAVRQGFHSVRHRFSQLHKRINNYWRSAAPKKILTEFEPLWMVTFARCRKKHLRFIQIALRKQSLPCETFDDCAEHVCKKHSICSHDCRK
jgi:hypothetical protein